MAYTCDLCQRTISSNLSDYLTHVDNHIVDLIKKDHPEWVKEDGICPQCVEYYRREIEGRGGPSARGGLMNTVSIFWKKIKKRMSSSQ